MKKALQLTMLALLIGLLATVAYAQDQPGYGTDPDLDPPRSGVGNANSGNHNMLIHNYWYRWGTVDDSLFLGFAASTEDPVQTMDGFRYGPGDGTGFGPGMGDCVNDGTADAIANRRQSRR